MKSFLFIVGLIWSGGLITAQAVGYLDLKENRDFFLGVFGGCTAGLGVSRKKEEN